MAVYYTGLVSAASDAECICMRWLGSLSWLRSRSGRGGGIGKVRDGCWVWDEDGVWLVVDGWFVDGWCEMVVEGVNMERGDLHKYRHW